jgi:hypothetical protein
MHSFVVFEDINFLLFGFQQIPQICPCQKNSRCTLALVGPTGAELMVDAKADQLLKGRPCSQKWQQILKVACITSLLTLSILSNGSLIRCYLLDFVPINVRGELYQ